MTLANTITLPFVESTTARIALTGGLLRRDIESKRSRALMRALIYRPAGSMTLVNRPATESATAKTRYCRSAEWSWDSANRIPRIASMNLSSAGGIVFEMVETGNVDKRRKYEFLESSDKVSRFGESTAIRPCMFVALLNISADPFFRRGDLRGSTVVGDLAIFDPPHIGEVTAVRTGDVIPRPRERTSSKPAPLSRRS